MSTFILAFILIALAIAGIAIKMFVFKDAQFTKSCSSVDTGDNSTERIGCVCGTNGEDEKSCKYYELHHGAEKE